MVSFGYTINETDRFHTDFALKWNYASASTSIHHNIKGAALEGLEPQGVARKKWKSCKSAHPDL